MSDPDFVIRLVTMTAMYDGAVAGGAALLPPDVVHVPPATGGVLERVLAKPLNAAVGLPPDSLFAFAQDDDQNVTVAPTTAERSPTTKAPRPRYVKTVVPPAIAAPWW